MEEEKERRLKEEQDPIVQFVKKEGEDLSIITTRVGSLITTYLKELKTGSTSTIPTSSTEEIPKLDKTQDQELCGMLNVQKPSLQLAVATELASRCQNQSKRDSLLSTLSSNPSCLRSISDTLLTDQQQLHILSLKVLFAVSDSNGSSIRRVGAIRTISEVLLTISDTGKAIIMLILQKLCSDQKNRTVIVRCGIVKSILEICKLQNPILSSTALKTLTILTENCNKSQEAVVKDGGGDISLSLAFPSAEIDSKVQLSALSLLKNLSACATFKSKISKSNIEKILDMLQVQNVYPSNRFIYNQMDAQSQAKCNAETNFQCAIFDILLSLSKLDSNKEAIGRKGTKILVDYITPSSGLAYEVFPWKMEIEERVLALLSVLLTDLNNKQEFINRGGLLLLVNALKLPEVFPESLEAMCAAIITGPLEKEMHSLPGLDVILLQLFKYLPNNTSLQSTLVDTFFNLSKDENGSQRTFEEGGVHVLFKLLITENSSVRLRALSTIASLSNYKFIRKVMRLLDPELKSIASCAQPLLFDERSHSILVTLLSNLTISDLNETSSKEFLENQTTLSNCLPIFGSICGSHNSEIRKQAINSFLEIVTKISNGISIASSSGALFPVFQGLISTDIDIQADMLLMSIKLCSCNDARPSMEMADFVSKLKEAGRSHNVCKKGSKLVEVVAALIAAWKKAPGESKKSEYEAILDAGEGSVLRLPISPTNVDILFLLDRASSLLGAGKRDHVVIQHSSKSGENSIPKNSEELRTLIASDIKSGLKSSTFTVFVKKTLRKTVILRNSSSSSLKQSPSTKKPPPTTTKTTTTTTTSINPMAELGKFSPEELKKLVILLCEQLKIGITEAIDLLEKQQQKEKQQQEQKKQQAVSGTPPPPPIPSARAPSPPPVDPSDVFGSMLSELKKTASSGLGFLNHVDMTAEQVRKASENQNTKKLGILRDIISHSSEHIASKRLISQETCPGKQIWKRSVISWINEVSECVLGNGSALLYVVFKLITNSAATSSRFSFDEAMKLLVRPIPKEIVAKQLIRIGFSVVQAFYNTNGEDTSITEFVSILIPDQLPMKQLLRILEYKIAEAL